MLRYSFSLALLFIFTTASWAAESPFVGSWKLAEATADLTLKSDGTGILKLVDREKAIPFTWKKTSQGATISFAPGSAPGPEASNLFLQTGKGPGELLVKDSTRQTTWRRDDGETRRAIEKLLQVSGMDKFIEQQAGLMTFSFRSTKSNVSPDTWTKLEQELDKDLRDAREEIITNYEVAYTLDEIKALNAFYESPVGRKELTTRPFLIQHVVQILQGKTDRIANAAGRETGTQKK